jgi:DNA-binding MarR family transcriptional regulator
MQNPNSLETNIIYLTGQFSHAFHQALTLGFKRQKISVTVEQFSVLAVLFYKNGINQKELGALLLRDKTTVARIITNMLKNKLVKRVTDKNDNRANLLYLTKKGELIQKKAIKLSGTLYLQAIKDIPETQLKRGRAVLSKMMKNIPGTFGRTQT